MLKQRTPRNSKQQRLNEAALKHKVRNLRAKVQSLLPIDLCFKIHRRSNLLEKQKFKMQEIQEDEAFLKKLNKTQCAEKWKYHYNIDPLFTETGNPNLQRSSGFLSAKNSVHHGVRTPQLTGNEDFREEYHFERLTDEEIEQIGEDIVYYLGNEKNIEAYKSFLSQREKGRPISQISNQMYKGFSKSTIAIGTNKDTNNSKKARSSNTSFDFNSNKQPFREKKTRCKLYRDTAQVQRNSYRQSDSKKTVASLMTSKTRKSRKTVGAKVQGAASPDSVPSVQYNISKLNEQQQIRRVLMSMQLRNRHQRVKQNAQKVHFQKRQHILEENEKQNQKIIMAQQKKKKIDQQAGDIVELTEKLRRVCIQRKTYKPKIEEFAADF